MDELIQSDVFDHVQNVPLDISSDAIMEDSFSSFGQERIGPTTSTPQTQRPKGQRAVNLNRVQCSKCPKTYANDRTLTIHMKTHFMEAASKRAPTYQEVVNKMPDLVKTVLKDLSKDLPVSQLHTNLNAYTKELENIFEESTGTLKDLLEDFVVLLSGNFSEMLAEKALFPSAIKVSILKGTNLLVTSTNFREEIKKKILQLKDTSSDVLNVFLGEFMFILSQKVLFFSMSKIRDSVSESTRRKRSSEISDSKEFKEMVHYIGGSIVSGLIWKGKKYKTSSPTWELYLGFLETRFIQSGTGQNACVEEISAFTAGQDRGGLTYISQDCFEFFSILFDFLMCLEGEDGSLPEDIIDKHVLLNDSVICLLWYDLVQSELKDEESLDLLIQCSQCCVRVVAKGILKRRLNEHLQKSYSSVPLRSRLAL